MGLSTKWNMSDNIYVLQRQVQPKIEAFNTGTMGLFEAAHDGKVNKCIADFAATHSRKETLLYNNRLYLGTPMGKVHSDQYEANRQYILAKFGK